VWITINSPFNCGNTPAGLANSIKGHAEAYRFYKDELKGTGRIGIKIGIAFPVLKDPRNQTHIEAAQRYRNLYMGVLADPITLGKQFPSAYTSTIPNVTLLTDAELARINGTSDFFAINEYSGQISSPPAGGIAACVSNSSHPLWPWCTVQETVSSTSGWALGYYAGNSAVTTPQLAIRTCLNYLWARYKLPIVISEFGFPKVGEASKALPAQRFDQSRSEHYMAYLSEMLKAM
jgi:beta-glucosidase/6-phospho-beta-glucosidase/beta-galactosidase